MPSYGPAGENYPPDYETLGVFTDPESEPPPLSYEAAMAVESSSSSNLNPVQQATLPKAKGSLMGKVYTLPEGSHTVITKGCTCLYNKTGAEGRPRLDISMKNDLTDS